MAIQVTCPGCGSTVSAPDESAGKMARCGSCLEIITVPLIDRESAWIDDVVREERMRVEPVASKRRSRRPRAKSAPKSTRWVWWLVGGIVLVTLLGGGAVGFAVWKFSRPNWQTHEPDGGGFRVQLPAAPRDLAKLNGVNPGAGVRTFGTVHGLPRQEYAVIWVDIDPWQRGKFTDEALLDNAVKELVKDGQGIRKESDRTLTQNGFAAREVVLNGDKVGGTALFRVVIAETRCYMVIVGGGANAPAGENAQHFLDSFEITDPQLFAALKQREEKAAHEEVRKQAEVARLEETRQAQAEQEKIDAVKRAELKEMQENRDRSRRQESQAFVDDRYTGTEPPDPATLPGAKVVIHFDEFDQKGESLIAHTSGGKTKFVFTGSIDRGPGVRGKAVFMPQFFNQGIQLTKLTEDLAYTPETGQTISIWLKSRATVRLYETTYYSPYRTEGIHCGRENVSGTSRASAHAKIKEDEHWHHYVLVRGPQGENQEYVNLYIDGKQVASGQAERPVNPPAPADVRIGQNESGEIPDPYSMTVGLDELAVYDRALSADEIKYLAGRGPKP